MSNNKTSEVKFSFYNIDQCGFYRGKSAPFGSIMELLSDLNTWSKNLTLENTKLFEPSEESDSLPTYLFNITSIGDDWLITTWNETLSTEAGVASVMKDSTPTSPQVVLNSIDPNSIPGYPTYFWFMPQENLFASIRFNNSPLTGYASLKQYLKAALTLISHRMIREEKELDGNNEITIKGYKDDNGKVLSAHARFNARRAKNNHGNIEKILRESANITKIQRKATLNLNVKNHLELWQKFCLLISLTQNPSKKVPYNVKYEVPFEGVGNSEAIQQIIDEWDANENSRSDWDDIGFKFKGESSKTYWLSTELLSAKISLEINENNEGIVDNKALLKLLQKHKQLILSQIQKG